MKISIAAYRYEDEDDCLQAAVDDYLGDHPELEEWEVSAAWKGGEDGDREWIILTVED